MSFVSGDDTEAYEPITRTILEIVAEREDTDPAEIEPPLHKVVDPDALNSLFAPTSRGNPRVIGRVVFAYCGYKVTAYGDGRVDVQELDEEVPLGQDSPEPSCQ